MNSVDKNTAMCRRKEYGSHVVKFKSKEFIIIIIIMFVKGQVRSLFLSPQSGVGPSISSSVVQCSVFLLICISVPVLAVYFCPSSVRVVATCSGTVLFPLLCSVLPLMPLNLTCHYAVTAVTPYFARASYCYVPLP